MDPGDPLCLPPCSVLGRVTLRPYLEGTVMLGTPIDAPTSTRATDAHLIKVLGWFREINAKLSELPD